MKLTEYQLQKILELATIEYRLYKKIGVSCKMNYMDEISKFGYIFNTALEAILGFDYPAAFEFVGGIISEEPPTIEKIQEFFADVKPITPPYFEDPEKNISKEHLFNYNAYLGIKDGKNCIEQMLK